MNQTGLPALGADNLVERKAKKLVLEEALSLSRN